MADEKTSKKTSGGNGGGSLDIGQIIDTAGDAVDTLAGLWGKFRRSNTSGEALTDAARVQRMIAAGEDPTAPGFINTPASAVGGNAAASRLLRMGQQGAWLRVCALSPVLGRRIVADYGWAWPDPTSPTPPAWLLDGMPGDVATVEAQRAATWATYRDSSTDDTATGSTDDTTTNNNGGGGGGLGELIALGALALGAFRAYKGA